MLVRRHDEEARRKAQRLRFQVTSDPMDIVAKVDQVPSSKGKGHVVLAPPADTDFSVSGMIAVALMGCFYATPKDFLSPSPSGIAYTEKYKGSKQSFHVAASAALATELPTLPQLLRGIAQAAEWPELQSARRLVELSLVWKTASGNLERRFRQFREI